MAKLAGEIATRTATGAADYEQPLSERMRTFLRLEFLYQQMLYNGEEEADWATRATISTLLEILAILSRGDVRSEVLKELDHQLGALERFQSQPGVDSSRLGTLVNNLVASRDQIGDIGIGFLQPLKDNEFLNAIKHRSAIPGGTCEFDLPEYNHWLRQPIARRLQDLAQWIEAIRPICDAVSESLWLIRESAHLLTEWQSTACTNTTCRKTGITDCCASAWLATARCSLRSVAVSTDSPYVFWNGRPLTVARCRQDMTSRFSCLFVD